MILCPLQTPNSSRSSAWSTIRSTITMITSAKIASRPSRQRVPLLDIPGYYPMDTVLRKGRPFYYQLNPPRVKMQDIGENPIEHAARKYQAYPGSQYALPTDDLEQERLILQHQTLKKLFGNRILLAPVKLEKNDKVLDIGTGPGLWIMDLAASVDPSVSIVGVDIESRLFLTSPPKNIELRLESVVNLPSEWTDTFALVHQRLLMIALQISQWPVALREIYRVLRPGGWVQLGESTAWIEGQYPNKPCMEKLVAMYRCLTNSRNLYIDCADAIPSMLEAAGFVDIQRESQMPQMGKWAGELGVASRINHVGVLRGIKTPILKAGGYGHVTSEKEYDALLEGLEREWDETPTEQNPGTQKEFVIVWARKPDV
ncbi:S-adenosyl-L-methionine-dependent methyltransferase [Mycena pura]|uniref:S-adenosyl-L-methionine-dependent methyltransferase n=1 Tax=Mycena pura TaxID=153505 RepID=A0AAD6USI4_9AGAR|nr:S-adenosyl-L-methionine-dependent methyltransferase [Mycena pura]